MERADMTLGDVNELAALMRALYEDRFPGMTPAMAEIWREDLAHLECEVVRAALRRWVRFHADKAPSLDQLCEQVELVQEDQRQSKRSGSSTKSYVDVLKDLAAREASTPERSADDATYAHYMVLLGERSIEPWTDEQGVRHEKMTQEQRGDQCYVWAEKIRPTQPELAKDLEAAGRQFLLTLPLQFGD
jgi:Arc/MetJ-type ribon-helix-helix transcriptional regulator